MRILYQELDGMNEVDDTSELQCLPDFSLRNYLSFDRV